MTIKKIVPVVLSILFLFLVWIIIAKVINAPLILPSPKSVFESFVKQIGSIAFWKSFLYTFLRVIISFCISLVIGFLFGFLCASNSFFHDFFKIPLSVLRSTPVISIILIALFWFNSSTVPVFVGILMTLPIVTTSVEKGLVTSNQELIQMSKIYKFTKKQTFIYIKLHYSIPYIATGALSSFGLSWKVIAAGEVLSLPRYGIGSILQKNQVHLESANIISATIILVTVSFILERILNKIFGGFINAKNL